MSQGAQKYKSTQVLTSSPERLLILLYEAAIRQVKTAVIAIDEKNWAKKGMAIGKAHDIINELNSSLDHKIGGDIAKDLERLYNFMVTQLLQANLDNSKAPLTAVLSNLETLLEGWREAVSKFQKDKPTPPNQT